MGNAFMQILSQRHHGQARIRRLVQQAIRMSLLLCKFFWSGAKKNKEIEMEILHYLQAVSHTWSGIEPNELPDLEWEEKTFTSGGSRLSSPPGGYTKKQNKNKQSTRYSEDSPRSRFRLFQTPRVHSAEQLQRSTKVDERKTEMRIADARRRR